MTPQFAAYNSGEFVTLRGEGLFGGSQVTFGGVPSPSVELLSSETLRVRVPANITGPVDLRLLTPAPGSPVSARIADSTGSSWESDATPKLLVPTR